jgi:hypothetical protein
LEYIYARFMGRPGSWAGQAGVWMGLFRVKWATIVFKWVAFSCRVRAGTACRDRGPDTAHHRVVSALTLRPSCRARVRVVFLVSCIVPPVVSAHLHIYSRSGGASSRASAGRVPCAEPTERRACFLSGRVRQARTTGHPRRSSQTRVARLLGCSPLRRGSRRPSPPRAHVPLAARRAAREPPCADTPRLLQGTTGRSVSQRLHRPFHHRLRSLCC